MIPQCLTYFFSFALLWGCWRVLYRYMATTSLDNIPGPPSYSLLMGNLTQLFNPRAWDYHKAIAKSYGSVIRIKAFLGANELYVFDPKALHHILVKDQYVYEESSGVIATNSVTFGNGLLATLGEHHRKQRKLLNPLFSTTHLRAMVPIFYEVSHKLQTALTLTLAEGPQEIDVLQWMSRTALELVGQAGLGYSFDTLTVDAIPHPYIKAIKSLMPAFCRMSFYRSHVLPWAIKVGTPRFRRFVVDMLPWDDLRQVRDAVNMMHDISVEIFEAKKRALKAGDEAVSDQIGQGKDIISILMKANMEMSESERMPESEVIEQMSTLIFAAMDTTSTALSRILHVLSERPDAQKKLRDEIAAARHRHGDEELSYDELAALPYLDAVCRETLRLYPPIPLTARTTRRDIVLPLSTPILGVDGKEVHEILVPNNTNITLSLLGANCNPDVWGADAGEWKPERWIAPLPGTVVDARVPGVYSHLMTFIGGGRACIGFKFSELEIKVVLSLLIGSFRFAPSGKEVVWHMDPVVSPVVWGSLSGRPEFPLVVSLVDRSV